MARRNKKVKILNDIKITDIVAKGKGIAKVDGKVIFVEDAVPGDIVDARVIKNRSDYTNARIHEIKTPSDLRIEPFCAHFEACGGCKWQYLSYVDQLHFKQQIVENNFSRIAKSNVKPLPIIGSSEEQFYRNKMEYSFSHNRWKTKSEIESDEQFKEEPALGFHVPGFFDKIVDIEKCWLQDDFANEIRNTIRDFALKNNYEFYNIKNKTGLLRNLYIRNTTLNEWMLLLCFGTNDETKIKEMMDHLDKRFPQLNSLLYLINEKANDTIYDLDIINYKGSNFITEQLGALKFKITAKAFFQTNTKQANKLYEIISEFAGLKGNEIVYDLYSGTGSIALFLAAKAKKVIGIETVKDAVSAANENKLINNIDNAIFYEGEIRNVIEEVYQNEGKPDVAIIDPPRMGLHPKVISQLLDLEVPKIIYVSCNPATQARDVQLLQEKYQLEKYQPIDMFPHTYHIENVAALNLITT